MRSFELIQVRSIDILKHLLLFGCSLLGSWLLGGLLGSWFLSSLLCWLLGSRLLGSLLWLLSGLLGSRLLSSLLWLLGLWLLSLLDLLWLFSLDNLVGSSSFSGCSGHLESSLGNSTLEGQADLDSSLSSINLVVGTDVLEDGLAGGASAVLQGGDGGSDHHGVLGVGSGGLGLLGCSSSRHFGGWFGYS